MMMMMMMMMSVAEYSSLSSAEFKNIRSLTCNDTLYDRGSTNRNVAGSIPDEVNF
jgi:hypothetical protein